MTLKRKQEDLFDDETIQNFKKAKTMENFINCYPDDFDAFWMFFIDDGEEEAPINFQNDTSSNSDDSWTSDSTVDSEEYLLAQEEYELEQEEQERLLQESATILILERIRGIASVKSG